MQYSDEGQCNELNTIDDDDEENENDNKYEDTFNYIVPLNIKHDKVSQLKNKCHQTYKNKQYELCIDICETLMAIGPQCDVAMEKRIKYIQQLHSRWLQCHYYLGILKWNKGYFAESSIHWIKINQFDDQKSASSHYYEGQWHWMNNDLNKAITSFQKAVELKPNVKKYAEILNNIWPTTMI